MCVLLFPLFLTTIGTSGHNRLILIMITDKAAIITGAYGAIGKAIAGIIALKGFQTVLIGRDETKLRSAVKEITDKTGNKNIRFEVVDLSRKQSIMDLSSRWNGPLNILINNAAASPRRRIETPEHIEIQFATNVLGYFWMTESFSGFMKDLDNARIVNVASSWAGGLDLSDLEFNKRKYNNNSAYRQSKQANRMLTVAFARKYQQFGITVNACHPGDVNSKLSNDLGFGGHESPYEGASTPVWVATDPSLKNITGKYFEYHQQADCCFSSDMEVIERLYRICEGY